MINAHFLLIMAVGEDRIYHMFNLVEIIIIIIMVVFQYYTKLNSSISKNHKRYKSAILHTSRV